VGASRPSRSLLEARRRSSSTSALPYLATFTTLSTRFFSHIHINSTLLFVIRDSSISPRRRSKQTSWESGGLASVLCAKEVTSSPRPRHRLASVVSLLRPTCHCTFLFYYDSEREMKITTSSFELHDNFLPGCWPKNCKA